MILNQVSYIDCIVFLIFLAPQLLIQVGPWSSLQCLLHAVPFLLFKLPFQLINDRYFTRRKNQTPFQQRASFFEDLVIRCVRYAFAEIPASVGRVFFSAEVALPFFRFRMLRHGYLGSPVYWREVNHDDMRGLWIIADERRNPDVIIYYFHGGGFSMGSSYFYLEFLIALVHLLRASSATRKFQNPALFALEYSLVPDATYPTQVQQALAGYNHLLAILPDPSRICLAGDSAGATLALSLLLHLSRRKESSLRPGFAILISPWVTLDSQKNENTKDDYLNADILRLYARQYIGSSSNNNNNNNNNSNKTSPHERSIISPGTCKDEGWWRRAVPTGGLAVFYGTEEVLAAETRDLVALLRGAGLDVIERAEQGGIHAWPVATLFLSDTGEARLKGLREMVELIGERMAW